MKINKEGILPQKMIELTYRNINISSGPKASAKLTILTPPYFSKTTRSTCGYHTSSPTSPSPPSLHPSARG